MLAFAEQVKGVLDPRKFLDWLYGRPGDWFVRRDSGNCPLAVYLGSMLRRRIRVNSTVIAPEPYGLNHMDPRTLVIGVPPPGWVLAFLSLVDNDRQDPRINAVQAADILRKVMDDTALTARFVPNFTVEVTPPNLKSLPIPAWFNDFVWKSEPNTVEEKVLVAV